MGCVAFDEPTTAAIIAIAGDAGSGSAVQIVDGYPVEVTGTSEVLVSAVPCDVVWIAHNGAAGTITVRDAGVTGTGVTAAKTIDMAATATLQSGGLRAQYGVTATLATAKCRAVVRRAADFQRSGPGNGRHGRRGPGRYHDVVCRGSGFAGSVHRGLRRARSLREQDPGGLAQERRVNLTPVARS